MRNLEPISPTHPANPITPLMMAAQEESRRAAAGQEPAAEAPATEEGSETPAAAEPEPAAALTEERAPKRDRRESGGNAPAFVRCQIASLLLLLLGLGLGVAPSLSSKAAEWLEAAGRLHLQAGTLIVAGLLLFTVTVVWRVLWGIRGSLEAVGHETARIEQIAQEGHTLRTSIDTVKYANTTLAQDVSNLQVQIKRLTDIVSNPDYTVSIFRLAASVDQLGKHIEIHMKEQFEGAQRHAGSVADQSNHLQSQLAARLDQVQALAKDQHRIQYGALQEGIAQLVAASSQTNERVEKGLDTGSRIEARIQNQQEQLSAGMDSLLARSNQNTGQIGAALEDLGGRVDRQLGGHVEALQSKLAGIDGRIDAGHRAHAAGIRDLGREISGTLAGQAEEIQQKLRTMAELGNANRQEIAGHVAALGSRMDDQARNQLDAFERVRESGLESSRTLQREISTTLAHLEAQLGETAREHAAVLRKSAQESQQAAGTARRELAARLEQIGMDLERQGREQQAAIQKAAQELQQVSGTTRRELTTRIEGLGAELDRQTHEQLEAILRSAQESKSSTHAAQVELAGTVAQLGTRLDERLESRANELSSDLIELAEMLGTVTQDLRTTLIDAVRPLIDAASRAPQISDLPPMPEFSESYDLSALDPQLPPDHVLPEPIAPTSALLYLEGTHPELPGPEAHEEDQLGAEGFGSMGRYEMDENVHPGTSGEEWGTEPPLDDPRD